MPPRAPTRRLLLGDTANSNLGLWNSWLQQPHCGVRTKVRLGQKSGLRSLSCWIHKILFHCIAVDPIFGAKTGAWWRHVTSSEKFAPNFSMSGEIYFCFLLALKFEVCSSLAQRWSNCFLIWRSRAQIPLWGFFNILHLSSGSFKRSIIDVDLIISVNVGCLVMQLWEK